MTRTSSRIGRAVKVLAVNVLVLFALLVVIEGLASLSLFVRRAKWLRPEVAERLHTTYDAELGWVNQPHVRIENLYGPGAHLTTNTRGFRGKDDVQAAVPAGRRRVVCSGDSFTLGYGVGDEQTWCHQLTVLDAGLETVNMGQGGYGVDQAYLWYLRDGTRLQHHIQVFAFITDDFARMRRNHFLGYAKPWLALENGRIVSRNVPVPKAGYGVLSWLMSDADGVRSLRSIQLGEGILDRLGLRSQSATIGEVSTIDQSRKLLPVLFAALKKVNEERGSRLVLVHLPTPYELHSGTPDGWILHLDDWSRRLGIPYVNLFDPFREMPEERWSALFLKQGTVIYPNAAGHLNVEGNRLVAALIHEALINVSTDSTNP